MGDMTSDDEVHGLVALVAAGDEAAWQRLWATIRPMLVRLVEQPRFLGRLGQREDDRENIIVDVMARLRADGFARLKRYADAKDKNPDLRFYSWLRVVAKRVGIDYLRRHPDYIDRRHEAEGSAPGAWVEAGTLPSDSRLRGDRPPVTMRGTARKLLDYAAGAIPDVHRRALELWVHGEAFADIAAATGLSSASEAEKAVRAAIERLRRRFRDRDSEV